MKIDSRIDMSRVAHKFDFLRGCGRFGGNKETQRNQIEHEYGKTPHQQGSDQGLHARPADDRNCESHAEKNCSKNQAGNGQPQKRGNPGIFGREANDRPGDDEAEQEWNRERKAAAEKFSDQKACPADAARQQQAQRALFLFATIRSWPRSSPSRGTKY